jgi:hypothetical protein
MVNHLDAFGLVVGEVNDVRPGSSILFSQTNAACASSLAVLFIVENDKWTPLNLRELSFSAAVLH